MVQYIYRLQCVFSYAGSESFYGGVDIEVVRQLRLELVARYIIDGIVIYGYIKKISHSI